jgi:hypothetical protein
MRVSSWLRLLAACVTHSRKRRLPSRSAFRPRVEVLEDRTAPAVFTVNTVADTPAVALVTGQDSAGNISLRSAIQAANATAGADTIDFALSDGLKTPTTDWWTIQPLTALPTLTDTVLVDGWSQAGAGSGLAPKVLLDGSIVSGVATGEFDGLGVGADGCAIRGLAIRNFTAGNRGSGIYISGADATIQGCYLGLDPSGNKSALGNEWGIISDGRHSMIGGTNPGEGNVISGNATGIGSDGPGTIIRGNRIRTNPAGTVAIPNPKEGIEISSPSALTPAIVGGTNPGEGNLISGNGQ